MRKRPLGKTGLVVSELALGTWALSGDGYGPVEPEEAERTVRAALDMGITLFDTSDAYGAGRMEQLLGKCVPKDGEAIIVTRVGIDRMTEPPRRRFDAPYLRDAIGRSLKRLGREALDVVLLHHPNEDVFLEGEATAFMKELGKEGLVKHWGVSAGDGDTARMAIDQGAAVVSLPYNLLHVADLNRVAGDVMVERPGVLLHSVLAYGLLCGLWREEREFPVTDHRSRRWSKHEISERARHVDYLKFLVRGDVLTMRGAALRFALASHVGSSVVLGPKSISQLKELVREAGAGPRYLSDEDIKEVYKVLERAGVNL